MFARCDAPGQWLALQHHIDIINSPCRGPVSILESYCSPSTAGFHQISRSITRLAAVRFRLDPKLVISISLQTLLQNALTPVTRISVISASRCTRGPFVTSQGSFHADSLACCHHLVQRNKRPNRCNTHTELRLHRQNLIPLWRRGSCIKSSMDVNCENITVFSPGDSRWISCKISKVLETLVLVRRESCLTNEYAAYWLICSLHIAQNDPIESANGITLDAPFNVCSERWIWVFLVFFQSVSYLPHRSHITLESLLALSKTDWPSMPAPCHPRSEANFSISTR